MDTQKVIKSIYSSLLYCLVLFSSFFSYGQDDLTFTNLTSKDGLDQKTVFSVVEDQDGFIWFGTLHGLSRFDGYEFQTFTYDSSITSINNNVINDLIVDEKGIIWIGTNAGLCNYNSNTGRFKNFPKVNESVTSLAITESDLIIGSSSGLFILNMGTEKCEMHLTKSPLESDYSHINAVLVDQNNTIWLGTNGGLAKFNRDLKKIELPDSSLSLTGSRILSLYEDSNDRLWVGSFKGLSSFQVNTKSGAITESSLELASIGPVSTITSLDSDNLAMGTLGNGVLIYNTKSGRTTAYTHDPKKSSSLISDIIYQIYISDHDNLWVATRTGISMVNLAPAAFKTYNINNGLTDNMVRSVCEDNNGNLYMGTFNGGLNKFDAGSEKFSYYLEENQNSSTRTSSRIFKLLQDSHGDIWIATLGAGLYKFNPESEKLVNHWSQQNTPGTISSNYIVNLFEDSEGIIWISNLNGPLNWFDPKTQEIHTQPFTIDGKTLSTSVRAFLEDELDPNIIWIGSKDGLIEYNKETNAFKLFKHQDNNSSSLSSDRITSILIDSYNNFWVGSSEGLNLFNRSRETFERFHIKNQDNVSITYGLLEDSSDNLWVATNEGFSKLNLVTYEIKSFKKENIFDGNDFTIGSFYKSKNGKFHIGGLGGLHIFDPSDVSLSDYEPPVVITDFKITNKSIIPGDVNQNGSTIINGSINSVGEVNLSHKESSFSFDFASLDYIYPQGINYAYKLTGFNKEWIYTTSNKRFVNYTNLNPDKYQLRIRATNSDGVWSPHEKIININIQPPFWQQLWFKISALAIIIVGMIYIMKTRTKKIQLRNSKLKAEIKKRKKSAHERELLIKQLEAKNSEMERFNYTVSHDLKTPLITIKGYSGFLLEDVESNDMDTLKEDIKKIDSAASHMNELLNELLELSKVGRIVNEPELVDINITLSNVLENVQSSIKNININIESPLPVCFCDSKRIAEVFQNLIENAAKFMDKNACSTITIGGTETADYTEFYVCDNGSGIEKDYHKKIFEIFERLNPKVGGTGIGLALVKRIIEAHKGQIWVESEGLGAGSTFKFQIPKETVLVD